MILVFVIFALFFLYVLFILPTHWLKIERVHFSLGLNLKIVQISDLHVEMLRITPDRLQKILEKEKPDLIFHTGDFTRKDRYISKVDHYLKVINQTEVPIYAVLGNHDYRIRNISKLLQVLKKNHVQVLRNESVAFRDFQLIGIDDYGSGKSNIVRAFKNVNFNKPVVIITHDPNIVSQINKPFHYLMAGHLHGKQFNIPFFFKIKNKGELPSKGIFKGIHKNNYGTFYISKGIGQAGLNVRLLVRSEITIHYL